MRTFFLRAALVACGIAVAVPPAGAQSAEPPNAETLRKQIDDLKSEFESRLTALEAQLAAMQGGQAPPPSAPQQPVPAAAAPAQPTAEVPAGAQGAGGPSGSLPVYGSQVAGSKVFNPDMAVIGDFLGASGQNAINPNPALEMHESEASFQAVVDPYGRADFFMSFGEEGVELEEGFLTLTELPGGLLTKVGKMRAAFGKVNTLHNHILPWADRPLVTSNLVGGEEGIDDAGMSVARLIPNPWLFLEATGQVFRGDSSDVFHSSKRGDLSYVGHLRAYHDITESTNVDLGTSFATGHNTAGIVNGLDDVGRFKTQLYGVDATLRWRPLSRAIYHSFLGRSEVIWSHRDQFDGLQRSIGMYVSGDYQFARRWFVGGRYDRSDRAADSSLVDSGQSVILTFWPSEFSQVRGQYRRTRYAEDTTANEFLFQFQFSIGAHGAHAF
jgi:hypothetical protein